MDNSDVIQQLRGSRTALEKSNAALEQHCLDVGAPPAENIENEGVTPAEVKSGAGRRATVRLASAASKLSRVTAAGISRP